MEMGCQKMQLILTSILTLTSEWTEERKEMTLQRNVSQDRWRERDIRDDLYRGCA